jgi:Flp pilus assembly pilin Flp
VGQAFRGLAFGRARSRIRGVSKSHFLAWRSSPTKRGNRRLDLIRTKFGNAEGQALVEYALTVSLLAIVCIAALTAEGTSLSSLIHAIAGDV